MKNHLNRFKLVLLLGLAACARAFNDTVERTTTTIGNAFPAPTMFGPSLRQGGFVTLNAAYQGYAAGTVVELPASTEASLIASGQAVDAGNGPPTPGNVTTNMTNGCVGIAAGQSSVTVTNPNIKKQSQIVASIAQAAADGTLTSIQRIFCQNGSFTIYGNANATATVSVDWAVVNPNGTLSGS
jgi:hypothetical protein